MISRPPTGSPLPRPVGGPARLFVMLGRAAGAMFALRGYRGGIAPELLGEYLEFPPRQARVL